MLGGSPCHHNMARPQVVDGRDGLQLWRLAVNILNKQSWAYNKGWSSSLGLGVGLTTPHRKKQTVTKSYTKPRSWTDSLDERSKERNMDVTFGTWNVRSLYRAGSLMTVSRELSRYRLDLVGA
jgi:hypothetical protein